jgi:hypothetical protein
MAELLFLVGMLLFLGALSARLMVWGRFLTLELFLTPCCFLGLSIVRIRGHNLSDDVETKREALRGGYRRINPAAVKASVMVLAMLLDGRDPGSGACHASEDAVSAFEPSPGAGSMIETTFAVGVAAYSTVRLGSRLCGEVAVRPKNLAM